MPAMKSTWWKFSCFASGLCMVALRKAALAVLTCTFAFCGSLIGSVSGALKGQTTETGLFRGAGIGLVAGALVSVEILESCLQGELLSELAVFDSLLNGKVFPEWVSPAMLKAYQWQMNSVEVVSTESSDIFETPCNDGLLPSKIRILPEFTITREDHKDLSRKKVSCAVCLQDFMCDEAARRLPACGHVFHTACIDMWLLRHGSCPVCRHDVHCT